MGGLIQQIGPVELNPERLPPFQSIVHAIIHQQLSGKAAGTILKRFQALFHETKFPSPKEVAQMDVETLRTVGLSRPKAGYIHDLARKSMDGVIPSLKQCEGMTDQELLEAFTVVKGVGRWTVEMLLIFNLGRTDVLPMHDLGVRRGFQIVYRKRKMPEPEQLERFGKCWSPHRTHAALYLWRAVDSLKEGKSQPDPK